MGTQSICPPRKLKKTSIIVQSTSRGPRSCQTVSVMNFMLNSKQGHASVPCILERQIKVPAAASVEGQRLDEEDIPPAVASCFSK